MRKEQITVKQFMNGFASGNQVPSPEHRRVRPQAPRVVGGYPGNSRASLAVLGAEEARRLNFPVYELVRMINIGDFLERIDVIVLGIWINMVFVKAAVFFYLGTVSLARWLNPAFFKPEVLVPYTLPVAFMIPAFILAIALVRGQRGDAR